MMWPRVINMLLGFWLIAAPSILDYGGMAAINDRIVGPSAAAFAIIAMSEVTRPLRWLNVLIGHWLMVAPLALHYRSTAAAVHSVAIGLLMIFVAVIGGRIKNRYGGGWSSVWERKEDE